MSFTDSGDIHLTPFELYFQQYDNLSEPLHNHESLVLEGFANSLIECEIESVETTLFFIFSPDIDRMDIDLMDIVGISC